MLFNYIGKQHQFGVFDCIILVKKFYEEELHIDIELPSYSYTRRWYKDFTVDRVTEILAKNTAKVSLPDLKNYDLMIFNTTDKKYINHFGLYIIPNKILHIEIGRQSRVDILSEELLSSLYGVYRHNDLV